MKRWCPLCHGEMPEEHWLAYADYTCRRQDHFFGERLADQAVSIVKVSLRNGSGPLLYLKVHYREGFSQVWTVSSRTPRLTVPLIVEVDFSDANEIRRVIRHWLRRRIQLRWKLVSAGK